MDVRTLKSKHEEQFKYEVRLREREREKERLKLKLFKLAFVCEAILKQPHPSLGERDFLEQGQRPVLPHQWQWLRRNPEVRTLTLYSNLAMKEGTCEDWNEINIVSQYY